MRTCPLSCTCIFIHGDDYFLVYICFACCRMVSEHSFESLKDKILNTSDHSSNRKRKGKGVREAVKPGNKFPIYSVIFVKLPTIFCRLLRLLQAAMDIICLCHPATMKQRKFQQQVCMCTVYCVIAIMLHDKLKNKQYHRKVSRGLYHQPAHNIFFN